MYRDTHCPNCFKEPAPAGQCRYCGFDARAYSTYERNHFLPLFTSLENKYILGRVLGQGGLGIVYAGYQNLERQVAIKEFFPHTDSLRVDRRGTTVIAPSGCETLFNTWKDDFLEEAKLLAKFDHPHVVRVLTIEYANNTAYLVTERLQGCTLSDYLDGLKKEKPNGPQKAGRKLDSNEVLNLLNVALDILDVLHGHQPKPVIHRDLTPNNLFLVNREPEQLKVLDFGLARLGEGPASTIGGTNPFASPEQIGVINNDITSATDFYNLGASLYTALAGVTPPAAARRHNQPLLSLSSLPNVDPTLATIIRDCLEMDPSRRPKDVAEIRQRLAARTELPPKDIKPVTSSEPVIELVGSIQSTTLILTPKKKNKKKNKKEPAPETPNSVSPPKRRYRTLWKAIPLIIAFGIFLIFFVINQYDKLTPANLAVDVSPAPSTQIPTPLMPSENQKPTVAPSSEPASQDEKPFPPESPVTGVNSDPSTEVSNSILLSEIQKHAFALPSGTDLQKKEEFYARNNDELDAWPFHQQEAVGNSIIKAILGSWSQESLDGLDTSSEKAQHLAQQALPEIKRLADQGDLHAQFQLGTLYAKGLGVAKDEKQAVEWCEKAAKQGYVVAQNELGIIYKDGFVVTKDEKQAIEWFRKAAEQGYALAQNNLGNMYSNGLGVTKDYEQGLAWYRKAAEQGIAIAQFNLAVMYRRGHGVPKNNTQAIEWYRKAAEQGFAPAQYRLGIMYEKGQGVSKDTKQAMEWFRLLAEQLRKAAEQGDTDSQYDLGVMYEEGIGVTKDDKQAVSWYRKADEQGHAPAQTRLGQMYEKGYGVARDDKQAVAWYRKAAEQDFALAQTLLGDMYRKGHGVTQDDKQAVAWYRKAAEQDFAPAQRAMGVMYSEGQGIEKDNKKALDWFLKAADQGDAEAQHGLGWMYSEGLGVVKDNKQAVAWYRKAAEQGHNGAQTLLGDMYKEGHGVTRDDKQAVALYQKAAEQGFVHAQYRLAWMYSHGRGIAKDDKQAVAWYRRAAEQGEAVAQYNLSGMLYEMGDEQGAIEWLRKALDQGYTSAKADLKSLHKATEQGDTNAKAILKRLRKAAEQGDTNAKAVLEHLEQQSQ